MSRWMLVLMVLSACTLKGEVTALRPMVVYGHHLAGSRFGAVRHLRYQVQVNGRQWCEVSEDQYNTVLLGDSIAC